MNKTRKRSKSKRHWKYGFETREERLARLHASKDHSRRRKLARKNAPADADAGKAERTAKAKEAARKLFNAWLERADVHEMAQQTRAWNELGRPRHYGPLIETVRAMLWEYPIDTEAKT